MPLPSLGDMSLSWVSFPKGGSPMQQFLYDLLVGVLAAVIAALVIRRINR